MIINHTKKIIYFKNPKTAGTSTELFLLRNTTFSNPSDKIINYDRLHKYHHFSLHEFKLNSLFKDDDYIKITNIRNPWEQVASLYCSTLHKIGSKNTTSFETFVKNLERDNILLNFYKNLNDYNYFIRFENLENDLNETLKLLNLKVKDIMLPKIHHDTVKPDYFCMYNKETKNIVNELFSNVINCFNYKFKKKKIILVGNSEKVLEKELGEEINKFDKVIRFNSCKIKGFEKYVGTKTTDVFMGHLEFLNEPFNEDFPILWTYTGVDHNNLKYIIQRNPTFIAKPYDTDPNFKKNISLLYGHLKPLTFYNKHIRTTGLNCILLHILNECYDLYIHGIADGGRGHYWDSKFTFHESEISHNLKIEKEIIDKWVALGYLKRLD